MDYIKPKSIWFETIQVSLVITGLLWVFGALQFDVGPHRGQGTFWWFIQLFTISTIFALTFLVGVIFITFRWFITNSIVWLRKRRMH